MQTEFSEVKFMSDVQKDLHIDAAVPLASRRKLIRLGAVAVPVVATLTSQSALAGNCISTSAWGSDQVSGSASQAARHNSRAVAVNTGFTISAWNTASSSMTALTLPWTAFKAAYPGFTNFGPPNNRTFRQSEVTFDQLQNLDLAKFKIPTGSTGFTLTDKVVGKLTSSDASFFVVAQLNFAVGQKPPTQCITDADWALIVKGMFPPAPATAWDLTLTARYLKNNFIVQA